MEEASVDAGGREFRTHGRPHGTIPVTHVGLEWIPLRLIFQNLEDLSIGLRIRLIHECTPNHSHLKGISSSKCASSFSYD